MALCEGMEGCYYIERYNNNSKIRIFRKVHKTLFRIDKKAWIIREINKEKIYKNQNKAKINKQKQNIGDSDQNRSQRSR